MTKLNGRWVTVACAAGALLVSSWVLAGSKTNFPVLVDAKAMLAAGNLGSARNTGDFLQFIGCESVVDGTAAWGQCIARNASGLIGGCVTSEPSMIATIRAVSGDSFVNFEWDSFGFCTRVTVWNSSDNEPKRP